MRTIYSLFCSTKLYYNIKLNKTVSVEGKNKRSVVKKKNNKIADWIAIIGMKSHTCAGFIDFIKVNVVLQS